MKPLQLKAPIKLVMCDLDGTLLNSRSKVSQATKDAIARAAKHGIKVSIASGRCYPMQLAIAKEIGVTAPVITANGAQIIDTETDLPVYSNVLPDSLLIKTLSTLRELGVDCSALGYDICMFSIGNDIRLDFYRACREHAAGLGLSLIPPEFFAEDFSNVIGRHTAKLLVSERTGSDCERAREALSGNEAFDIYYSSPTLLEIMPTGIDKGTGVAKTAEYLGIPTESVAVFGDYDNDLPMFRKAGLPVAMGNALPGVKEQALYVCESNDNDGVARTLDLFIEQNKRLGY